MYRQVGIEMLLSWGGGLGGSHMFPCVIGQPGVCSAS